ncbi:MAG: Putative oxidoreductase [uncultured Friedmanniella sp.]|uniref:Oxidoreductase n=1 Tax=uncultured Friedmanniella sp. TaxID=335381 RepID=A0A6J4JST0_9ACTN|nr:MAG: Putative oxidoreductase [uncultured Friedmanniella sp.]
MEFGLTTFAEINDPTVSPGERLREVVEEAVLADQLGLAVYGIGEHHRPDMAASAPEIVLAAIAGRTENIRLSSAVTVLSSADPVRAFQNFATLDLLSGGRAELMAGRGSFTESFPLFGYDLGDYDELFAEKLDLLLALREEGPTTWSGQFRAPLEGVVVHPRPEGRPLPVWVAVGGTPSSIVRAGTLGLPLALAIIGGQPAAFAPHADLYRRALQHGGHPTGTPLAVHAHGYVATDEQAARADFLPGYKATFDKIGRERGWAPMSRAQVEGLLGPEGALFFGHPERVADKIVALHGLLGLDRFEMHVSHVDHARTMRSIELFATEVVPLVRSRLAAEPATV